MSGDADDLGGSKGVEAVDEGDADLDFGGLTVRISRGDAVSEGCCQTSANSSQFSSPGNLLGRKEAAPLGESGGAVSLEILSAVEGARLVECDRGVDGGEITVMFASAGNEASPARVFGTAGANSRRDCWPSGQFPARRECRVLSAPRRKSAAGRSRTPQRGHAASAIFFRNFNAAFLSRVFVTKLSSTSPSWSTARQR